MKLNVLRLVLSGLFGLSIVTAGATFLEVATVQAAPCPQCGTGLDCAGSTCTCQFVGTDGYKCVVQK